MIPSKKPWPYAPIALSLLGLVLLGLFGMLLLADSMMTMPGDGAQPWLKEKTLILGALIIAVPLMLISAAGLAIAGIRAGRTVLRQSDHLWTRLSGAPPRDVAGRYLQPENPELSKGTRSMSDANGSAHGCPRTPIRYVVFLFLLLLFLAWYIAIPRVHIYFSNNGNGRLGFIMNSQHDIYRNDIHPGQATAGAGHIFPDEDFFMQLDWNNAGRHHCICINPKWPVTNAYIGPDGDVDWRPGSGTDVDRIWPCVYGENC